VPITPVFEQPPVNPRGATGIDWSEVIDALTAQPGEWARVDGPFDPAKTGATSGRVKSLQKWGTTAGVTLEVKSAAKDGQRWLYARTVAKPAPKVDWKAAAEKAEAKKAPVATVPAPSPIHDDGTHAHQCDTCGDAFRTNLRLRQHQANAHKAS